MSDSYSVLEIESRLHALIISCALIIICALSINIVNLPRQTFCLCQEEFLKGSICLTNVRIIFQFLVKKVTF